MRSEYLRENQLFIRYIRFSKNFAKTLKYTIMDLLSFYLVAPLCRSSLTEVFLGKGVLKICSNFTGEHPCQSVISIKLLCNFIEIIVWHTCSPVNLLHIFRILSPKNTSKGCFCLCKRIISQSMLCFVLKRTFALSLKVLFK